MKRVMPCLFVLVLAFLGCTDQPDEQTQQVPSQETKTETTETMEEPGGYDAEKAAKYGADDIGMKKYVLAFLKKGPNRDRSEEEAAELQKAHLANIDRMAEEGKLMIAGPFLDDQDIRGIYIFNVETVEEAEALTNTDPAIKAGSLVMELRPWYGSAALMEVNDIHKTLAKQGIAE